MLLPATNLQKKRPEKTVPLKQTHQNISSSKTLHFWCPSSQTLFFWVCRRYFGMFRVETGNSGTSSSESGSFPSLPPLPVKLKPWHQYGTQISPQSVGYFFQGEKTISVACSFVFFPTRGFQKTRGVAGVQVQGPSFHVAASHQVT